MMNMGKWNRNGEGYVDSTAGIAIRKVAREERKTAMRKRRGCRSTAEERFIHEKAVKIRKMTDEQLVDYVEGRVQQARNEGFYQGKEQNPQISVTEFVEEIGRIRGIGEGTMSKIRKLLDQRLEENANA